MKDDQLKIKNVERAITKMPDFLLTLKGKIDARKGNFVVESYVQKLWEKTIVVEKKLAIATEKSCESMRKKGADDLLFMLNKKSDDDGTGKVRDDRSKETARRDIIQINEDLIARKAILEKAIFRTEHAGVSKINSYLYGVRKNLPDYKMETLRSSTMDEYVKVHQEVDDAIAAFAYESIRKGK